MRVDNLKLGIDREVKQVGERQVFANIHVPPAMAGRILESFFQYANPIESVVREITSNASDSHTEAELIPDLGYHDLGKKLYFDYHTPEEMKEMGWDRDRQVQHIRETKEIAEQVKRKFELWKNQPIEVTLNSGGIMRENAFFAVEDFGVGISPKRMKHMWSNMFSSTKNMSDDEIGGFGIGAYSPLGYVDMYMVTTRYNGIEYDYLIYKTDALPAIDCVREEETTFPNGTKVTVPIKDVDNDLPRFQKAVQRQLCYFDNIRYVGCGEEVEKRLHKQIFRGDSFIFRPGDGGINGLHLCLGKVYYPVDFSAANLYGKNLPAIGLYFDIGELAVTEKRESVKYTQEVIDIIDKRASEAEKELREMMGAQYDDVEDFDDYIMAYEGLRNRRLYFKPPVQDGLEDVEEEDVEAGNVEIVMDYNPEGEYEIAEEEEVDEENPHDYPFIQLPSELCDTAIMRWKDDRFNLLNDLGSPNNYYTNWRLSKRYSKYGTISSNFESSQHNWHDNQFHTYLDQFLKGELDLVFADNEDPTLSPQLAQYYIEQLQKAGGEGEFVIVRRTKPPYVQRREEEDLASSLDLDDIEMPFEVDDEGNILWEESVPWTNYIPDILDNNLFFTELKVTEDMYGNMVVSFDELLTPSSWLGARYNFKPEFDKFWHLEAQIDMSSPEGKYSTAAVKAKAAYNREKLFARRIINGCINPALWVDNDELYLRNSLGDYSKLNFFDFYNSGISAFESLEKKQLYLDIERQIIEFTALVDDYVFSHLSDVHLSDISIDPAWVQQKEDEKKALELEKRVEAKRKREERKALKYGVNASIPARNWSMTRPKNDHNFYGKWNAGRSYAKHLENQYVIYGFSADEEMLFGVAWILMHYIDFYERDFDDITFKESTRLVILKIGRNNEQFVKDNAQVALHVSHFEKQIRMKNNKTIVTRYMTARRIYDNLPDGFDRLFNKVIETADPKVFQAASNLKRYMNTYYGSVRKTAPDSLNYLRPNLKDVESTEETIDRIMPFLEELARDMKLYDTTALQWFKEVKSFCKDYPLIHKIDLQRVNSDEIKEYIKDRDDLGKTQRAKNRAKNLNNDENGTKETRTNGTEPKDRKESSSEGPGEIRVLESA